MRIWEVLGRSLTIAGIFSAAAAVAGVWVQLKTFNDAQHQRQIEDWQTSVVYQIIQDGKTLDLKQISEHYVTEAAKSSLIPREKLDDLQLRLVLINLIYKGIIIENAGRYFITPADVPESYVNSADYQNRMDRNLNIARTVIAEAKTPLNSEQLLPKMIAAGGDEQFLKDNLGSFLQQIQNNGIGVVQGDGRVAPPPLGAAPPMASPVPLVSRSRGSRNR
jgi:hypothetical protein